MTIITPTGISGITSITSTGNTLQFTSASGGNLDVNGLSVTSGTNINVSGVVTATSFVGNVTGNVNSSGVSTVTTLRATSVVGVNTIGVTTAYIGAVNDGPISGARNRIINGDMRIDQRNAGASVTPTDGQYTVDRMMASVSQTSKLSVQQNAGSVTPPTGFSHYLGLTSLSSYSSLSSDYFGILHRIEGFNCSGLAWGTASAVSVTLSFWVRSSLTGTFGGSFRNSAQNRCYVFSYTISSANTWEYKTISIPGDITGTWLDNSNGIGIGIYFDVGSGSTYRGSSGSWGANNFVGVSGGVSIVGTNGATFYLTGVQLEVGNVATPFERRSFGQELALCQRYYYESSQVGLANATTTGYSYRQPFQENLPHPVTMRNAPNPTLVTQSSSFTPAGNGITATSKSIIIHCGSVAVSVASGGYWYGIVKLDAEL